MSIWARTRFTRFMSDTRDGTILEHNVATGLSRWWVPYLYPLAPGDWYQEHVLHVAEMIKAGILIALPSRYNRISG